MQHFSDNVCSMVMNTQQFVSIFFGLSQSFFNKEKESNPNSKTGKWPTITAASTSKTNVDESLI